MERKTVVEALEELARLGEVAGENPFKTRAYAGAAAAIERSGEEFAELLRPGGLESLQGVGKGIASLVRELASTGTSRALEELRAAVPPGVRDLLSVRGLGPKKVVSLWRGLGVSSLGELEYACVENRLASLRGFGAKTQAKVLEGVRFRLRHAGRILLPSALEAASELSGRLGALGVTRWAWVGEVGRFAETVAGLDLLVATPEAERVAEALGLTRDGEGYSGGTTGAPALRMRTCRPEDFGAASVWETSSEPFRRALSEELARGGLSFGPRGAARDGVTVPSPDEAAFWAACGLRPVPPECRELPEALGVDPGELVGAGDLRGAFHVHTDWSDGSAPLGVMVEAAAMLGWEWVGVCDHSASASYAGGLSAGRLLDQVRAIRELAGARPGIRVFAGVESDILADGSLDYPPEVMGALDLVVASVHSRFSLDEGAQTDRLVRAVSDPHTTFLGHPTGRLLLTRSPYAHRWEEVVAAASRSGAGVELNANPHRLDVDWRALPGLRREGIRVSVNPDAHSPEGLGDVSWGILMARKGLARREDLWNGLSAEEVGELLRSRPRA